MNVLPKIAVSSLGEPLLPSTWSGTPANLCRELSQHGILGETIDSEEYAHRFVRLGAKVLGKFYYTGSPYLRLGRIERALRARHVARRIARVGITDLLHMGTLDLPIHQAAGEQKLGECRHYVFTDTTWDLWSRYSTDQQRVARRLSHDIRALDQTSYSGLAHIFSISEYVKENLVTHYHISPEKISVVGTGRGVITPYEGKKDYANGTILFVAKERFHDKGGDALVAGFRLARRSNPALNLIIAGSDEHHRLANSRENITTHGRLPLAELQALFNRASLYAMPAHNEPWGLVYLEALACKVPILGLNRLSIPEITRDGQHGFCLETAEPEVIADALLRAFSDPARLAAMGEAGQRHCLENFTWERTVERIVAVISGGPI